MKKRAVLLIVTAGLFAGGCVRIGPALQCHTGPPEHPQPICTYVWPHR